MPELTKHIETEEFAVRGESGLVIGDNPRQAFGFSPMTIG
jgi:hypothetical protein